MKIPKISPRENDTPLHWFGHDQTRGIRKCTMEIRNLPYRLPYSKLRASYWTHIICTISHVIPEQCENNSELFQNRWIMSLNWLIETSLTSNWNVIHVTLTNLSVHTLRWTDVLYIHIQTAGSYNLEVYCWSGTRSYSIPIKSDANGKARIGIVMHYQEVMWNHTSENLNNWRQFLICRNHVKQLRSRKSKQVW